MFKKVIKLFICRAGIFTGLLCVSVIFLATGAKIKDNPQPKILTEDMSKGSIQVVMTIDPAEIHLDKDAILTLKITSPSEIEVKMPDLEDRLIGFIQNGKLDKEPATHAGKTVYERQLLLSPVISDEYRLSPFPVTYVDKSKTPAETSWFPSKPVNFDIAPVIRGNVEKDIEVSMKPVWIYPPFKTVASYVVIFISAIILLMIAWKLFKRVRREIQLLRMSPKERALEELAELLAKDLVTKNLVKEFYVELTMIVRRYIEREHSIRAPEQTTEEFLDAVSNDQRFSREIITRLKTFLEAADLVKFAAYHPESDAITRATATAKDYVETDSAEGKVRQAAKGGNN
ncbi:MAG: hypothetical protein A2283_21385 [Lentisphaerae bacterium RIFOXYA12_FULL_48_11]|nr:MAG: hypothetical protein A2283_21385 [Lentisphaerae bacterium RIFOXYA12_FULL_48_11]